MSDYRNVLERIGGRAEMQEPAFDRMVRRKERRHRNRRLAAAGLGLGLTAVLVITLVNGYTRNQGVVVQTPSPTPLDRGAPPDLLPDAGSVPTPGGVGHLLFWYQASAVNGMAWQMLVYEDGRLLTNTSPVIGTDIWWVERRLTPEGVSTMREVIGRDLDAVGELPRSELVEASGTSWTNQISTGPGWNPVLTWGRRTKFGKHDVVADPEEAAALIRLREHLIDPSAWLPATAWAQAEAVPFIPQSYLVTVERLPSDFTWKWLYRESKLRDLEVPTGMQLPGPGGCLAVDLHTARALASSLDGQTTRFSASRHREPGDLMIWPAVSRGQPVLVRIKFPLPHETCEEPADH